MKTKQVDALTTISEYIKEQINKGIYPSFAVAIFSRLRYARKTGIDLKEWESEAMHFLKSKRVI